MTATTIAIATAIATASDSESASVSESTSDSASASESESASESASENEHSTDDSVEEVISTNERTQRRPQIRSLDKIERSVARNFPSMHLANGVVIGWGWHGGFGTRVCVEYRKSDARTGRVELGRFHSFKKSAATNIAAQIQSKIQTRSRIDALISELKYNRNYVRGLGMVF